MSARSDQPITGQTRIVGVIGDPVRHSLSPVIHNAAFAAMGLDWVSLAFPVIASAAADAMTAMRTLEIGGLSVTMPHKATIIPALDHLAPSAQALGVANCVQNIDGVLTGHNTDGDGFVASVRRDLGLDLEGEVITILGAGGAARSVVDAVGRAGAAEILIVNRTESKAVELCQLAEQARPGAADDISRSRLVVNTTSVGMAGSTDGGPGADVPSDPELFAQGQAVVDIIYAPIETAWLAAARARGLQTLNGVSMLVHQAAIALEIWTGMPPDIDAMMAAAEQELKARSGEHQ